MSGVLRQPVVRTPSSAAKQVSDGQAGFSGGANIDAAISVVDPNVCASVTNMRIVRDTEMAKRPGFRSVGTVANGGRCYPSTLGPSGTFLVLHGGYNTNSSGRYLVSSTTAPAITETAHADLAAVVGTGRGYAQFTDATTDVLYIGGLIGPVPYTLVKWDGTTASIVGGFAPAQFTELWVYNQRLFGCTNLRTGEGAGNGSQTLYWSALNDGDTIGNTASGGGFATIRTYGGQNIVGGFALGSSNYILHEGAVSVFRGLTFDDISISAGVEGVSPDIGTPFDWRVIDQVGYVVTIRGLLLFTESGVEVYDQPNRPDPIRRFIATTSDFIDGSWFIVDNPRANEVWIVGNTRSFSGTLTAHLFIYNKNTKLLMDVGPLGIRVDWVFSQPAQAGYATHTQPLFYNSLTGEIFGLDFVYDTWQVYQDDGINYASSVQCRRFYSDRPSDQKAWRSLAVQMGGGSGQTLATVGSATGAVVSMTTTSGTVVSTTDLPAQSSTHVQASGQGSFLDVTITDQGTSSTGWSVSRIDANGVSYGRRGG